MTYCERCQGQRFIMSIQPYPPTRHGEDAGRVRGTVRHVPLAEAPVPGSLVCPEHEGCGVIFSGHVQTVARPCPSCNRDWVHPSRRPREEPVAKRAAKARAADEADVMGPPAAVEEPQPIRASLPYPDPD
jgi:hypothetical protein